MEEIVFMRRVGNSFAHPAIWRFRLPLSFPKRQPENKRRHFSKAKTRISTCFQAA